MDSTPDGDAPASETEGSAVELVIAPARSLVVASPDPHAVLRRAIEQAGVLAEIIERKKLYALIAGRKYVTVEGWATLGALNDLWPYTERVEVERDEGGEVRSTAVVQARTGRGEVIARAEGFCSSREARWRGRDEYAVRSMSQTRATSKVFRQALAWILALAGYETTPAEERDGDGVAPPEPAKGPSRRAPASAGGGDVRADAIRLWNAHPSEAAAFARAHGLPASVAEMGAAQVTTLVEHLRSLG